MKEAQKKKGKQVERLIKEAWIRQGSPSKGAVLNGTQKYTVLLVYKYTYIRMCI